MAFFSLASPANKSGDIFDLKDGKSRLLMYFTLPAGDGKFLQFTRPQAIAQELVKHEDVIAADYLEAQIGIPIFSAKAKLVFEATLPGAMDFFACDVHCDGQIDEFFLAKVNVYLPIIDPERTEFRLVGSHRLIVKAAYKAANGDDFAIARDVDFCERLVVTDRFVEICQLSGLNIDFSRPT